MNTFFNNKYTEPKHYLIATAVSVFNEVVFFEDVQAGITINNGFLLGGKSNLSGPININITSLPKYLQKSMEAAIQTATIFDINHPLIKNIIPLTDIKNDWARLNIGFSTLYREQVLVSIPPPILIN